MTQHIKYPEEVRMEAIEAELKRLESLILRNTVDTPPEITKLVDEHFWELIDA